MSSEKKIIGRAERVNLPEFDLQNLPAKIDTGAFSSSLDCSHVEVVQKDGQAVLEFIPLHQNTTGYTGKKCYAQNFEDSVIRNANGIKTRYIIFTEVELNGERHQARFSLSDRSKMRYPVLIGRQFLSKTSFLIDVKLGRGLGDDEEDRK